MEDQQVYNPHVASSSNGSLFYQQMQQQHHQAGSQALHHSYDSLDMNVSESSSSSPLLSQDPRDVAKVGASTPSRWMNATLDNQTRVRSHSDCFDRSLRWNPLNDEGYQVSYYPQMDGHSKMTGSTVHKLDSFTQVFAQQNLRIHAMSQGLPQSSLLDADNALRQLLSLKSSGEQQTQPTAVGRYSQVSPQLQQGLMNQPRKQSFYYEYSPHPSQVQSRALVQQGHQFGQQMQSHPLMQQHPQEMQQMSYYTQHHQGMPEIQQQQFSDQISQYYLAQPSEAQPGAQQQHIHLQQQSHNSKAERYPQDQVHGMQLIQLGTAPQYAYQSTQPLRHPRHLTPQQEASPQKRYDVDSQLPVLMDSPVGLPIASPSESYSQEALGAMSNTTPHQQVLTADTSYLLGTQGLHHSPNTMWPQLVPDGQTVSPESRKLYPDCPEPNTLLTCSVCFKEFKSLPALNGHLRSHGGVRTSASHKQEEGEKAQQSGQPEPLTPIVMPVSVPVKLAASEPNAPLSSNADQLKNRTSDDEMPVLTRITVTPPSSPKAVCSRPSSEPVRTHLQTSLKLTKAEERPKPRPERRKYRHRPEPLFIPPPSFYVNTYHSGATLYQSQLRSPRIIGESVLGTQELPIYTPPPMLSPVRQGSGLFSSVITAAHNAHLPLTPLTPTPRVLLCRSSSIDGSIGTVTAGPGERIADVEPRINIGSRFQAEIPDVQCRPSLEDERHKAMLVWKPWPGLESEESQQKVDGFLRMSCSSILPGGGTNLEYALHSLYEANGNIMSALEKLLLINKARLKKNPLADYHYAGSDYWTNMEKKSFNKALITCNKDFFHVQKMIKTKSVSQCVEYYYTWKKILHMGRRHRTRLVELSEDNTTSADDVDDEELDDKKYEECSEQVQKSPEIPHPAEADGAAAENLGPRTGSFVCEMRNCGASFCSRQALNGHARIHGGTSAPTKVFSAAGTSRQKSSAQGGYCSVKSSPAHSTTSGETDPTSIFPCKVCGRVFYKIKSRNAHMKTHRQQEEQQKQKAQKVSEASYIADSLTRTLERTSLPPDILFPFDHFNLIKTMGEDFDDDVAQDLEDVLEETEVMHSDLLLDDEDADLLQDATDL